jgi:hypothetical protein
MMTLPTSMTRRLGAALLGLTLGLLPAGALAADFLVTTLNDGGTGSLRQAILDANANGAADTITFDATLTGGTIGLSSGQLAIANDAADPDLTIDGDVDGDGTPDITVTVNVGGNSRVFSIASGANATLQGLVITGGDPGFASDGGGIRNDGGTLTITNSSISGNRSFFSGGGISNTGTLTVANSTISGNTTGAGGSASAGGGISNSGTLTVANSTISGNTAAEHRGGGILNTGTLTITNGTISGNTADSDGGGISNTGTLTVANSTISGNSAARAGSSGGGINSAGGSVGIKSTIVAGNTAPAGADCNFLLTSLGFNLEGGTSCGFTAEGDQQNVAVAAVLVTDAGGAPLLAANGGPTETIALLDAADNPAVDAIPLADCDVDTDQRGLSRPQPADGNCDIGAFELEQALDTLTLTAAKDSFLRSGAADRNEGANPGLRLQASGNNRVVVGFDQGAIDGFGNITSATLVLTIAENADNWGPNMDRTVDAHPLTVDFAEGNGQNAGVPGSQSTRGSGPGVTWNCATDAEIANQATDCNPRWNGGSFGPATAPSVLHVNGLTGEVSWDVTDDVLAGASAWLIKKTSERQPGRVSYHSKEGAAAAGDPDLAPRLILE